ncbi:hypothetical protein K505DRAFT_303512 [Melanomma pulvis-pyrius CBS 109.77]|uniref:Transcription factor domain-containing protein n=1 Tax=Melanomma pulvis-pyrius CBS 109.77 TaxID=1314802 RepID=A0A6A6XEZ7_9PLEO|nr:hypothetical protein K505DRAFT_303512 [Melanomma pulvis-pyrius CBS 109.77]
MLSSTSQAHHDESVEPEASPQFINRDPESTYDVFRKDHASTLFSLVGASQPRDPHEVVVTEQSVELLRIYQSGIGKWMDVLDHSLSYQRQVVRRSLSSSLLLHSVCALAAKQMSLASERFLWEPVSARYYGESLRLLIQDLNRPETSHEIVLAATILLCSYELLAAPGLDYERHLYGARTLIQARGIGAEVTDLEQASFWVYARQDVAMAVMNECPTLIPTHEWPAPLGHGFEEDTLGCQILWLLARVLELRFGSMDNLQDIRAQGLRNVSNEIDQWWDQLPSTARGVCTGDFSEDGLLKVWFYVPSAAAALLYYHMSKILILEDLSGTRSIAEVNTRDSPSRRCDESACLNELRSEARSIASICFSRSLQDSVLPVAVNPLFYAARHIPSLHLKARIWTLLDEIETRIGFHTKSRVVQLQGELEIDSNARH